MSSVLLAKTHHPVLAANCFLDNIEECLLLVEQTNIKAEPVKGQNWLEVKKEEVAEHNRKSNIHRQAEAVEPNKDEEKHPRATLLAQLQPVAATYKKSCKQFVALHLYCICIACTLHPGGAD